MAEHRTPRHRPAPATARTGVLDGLRGVAVTLVVLSHAWVLHPFDRLDEIDPLDSLFRSGSVAVTIFLVVSGFLVTRSMLDARRSHGAGAPFGALLRRVVRIGAQVALLLVTLLVVKQVDRTDPASQEVTWDGLVRGVTFTLNTYMRDNALSARADIGHLWYLSVEMQFFVVAAVVVALWASRTRQLVVALVVLVLLVTWWRWHVYDVEGWYSAALRTTTRVDGLLYGALAALVADRVARRRTDFSALLSASALVVLGVVASTARLDIEAYFKVQGVVLAVATTLLVLASQHTDGSSLVERALGWAPLRRLGVASLTVYVWHLPLFWLVSRHTPDWSAPARAVVGGIALVVLVVVLERLVEGPVRRWSSRLGRPARPVSGAAAGADPPAAGTPARPTGPDGA
ncbi:acyltransferase family protein [Angustibacter speluncae]